MRTRCSFGAFGGPLLLTFLLWTMLAVAGFARPVTLAWDASADQDVVSYAVHYGTSTGIYPTTVVSTQTSITLNLTQGTYFCTVTAKNSAGLESLPSAELRFDVLSDAPTLVGLADGQSLNGPAPVTLQITAPIQTFTRIEIYSGNLKIGDVAPQSLSTTWQNAPAGDYTLTVKAWDATGTSFVSAPVRVHVVQPAVTFSGLSAAGCDFNVAGAPGKLQSVYAADNLGTWVLLQSKVNTTGTLAVRDTAAGAKRQRFYRVVSE